MEQGSFRWDGPQVPDQKPAFVRLYPERSGRTWVLREKASVLSAECSDGAAECWIPEGYWLDAFDPTGRFLGSASIDRRPVGTLFIDGDMVVAIVLDDAGTIMVKRYRLVLPPRSAP